MPLPTPSPRGAAPVTTATLPFNRPAILFPPPLEARAGPMTSNNQTFEGGCTCGHVRYRMTSKPMWVNACHCTWCQRETGGAFATNALIEADRVELTEEGDAEAVDTPIGQRQGPEDLALPEVPDRSVEQLCRRGRCRSASCGSARSTRGHGIAPNIHIFTSTKQPWVVLPPGVPAVPEYFNAKEMWPQGEPRPASRRSRQSLMNRRTLLGGTRRRRCLAGHRTGPATGDRLSQRPFARDRRPSAGRRSASG